MAYRKLLYLLTCKHSSFDFPDVFCFVELKIFDFITEVSEDESCDKSSLLSLIGFDT